MTDYKHDASDKKLDHAGDEAAAASGKSAGSAAQGHDPAEIRKHDDAGKDRLFEGREQHDEAEKNSEKSRLAKDVDRHNHKVDDDGDVTDAGTADSTKRKS